MKRNEEIIRDSNTLPITSGFYEHIRMGRHKCNFPQVMKVEDSFWDKIDQDSLL